MCSLVHPVISPAARVLLWMNRQPWASRRLSCSSFDKATGLSTDQLITSFLVFSSAFFGLFQLPLLSLTPSFEKEPLLPQIWAHTSRTRDFLTEIKPLLHRGLGWKRQVTRLGEFQVFLPREAICGGRVGTSVFRNKATLWCVQSVYCEGGKKRDGDNNVMYVFLCSIYTVQRSMYVHLHIYRT